MSPQTKLATTFLKIAFVFAAISLACDIPGVTRDVLDIRDWYVNDATGSDANSCETPAAPCLTINAAIDKATDLDVVHIAAGIYSDEHYSSREAVSIDKNIILQGDGWMTTFIDGHTTDIVILIDNATVTIQGVTIRQGMEGIRVFGSPGIEGADSLILQDSRVINNTDGGMWIWSEASAVIDDVRINRNGVVAGGPGITNDGTLVVRNSTVAGNGKGISLRGSSGMPFDASITNSRIRNNIGNGLSAFRGSVTIEGSVFDHNEGDGIRVNEGEVAITNSTISANGTGIYVTESIVDLSFVTIFDNSRDGLHITGSAPSTVTANNSLIAENDLSDCAIGGFTLTTTGRNIATDSTCTGFSTGTAAVLLIDPVLAKNGGPTENHALLPGSPAIDTAPGPCLPVDQRGASRPYGSACDVGAYEFDPTFGSTTMSLEDEELDLITVTPSQQDDATPTPTPQTGFTPPLITTDSLCWTGPGNLYGVISSVKQGVEVELLGVGDLEGWLVVDNPLYNVPCWLPDDNLDLDPSVDLTTLKVFPVPPLPTPTVTQAQPTATATPKPVAVAPNTPSSLAANETACDTNNGYVVKLTWKDNASNEDGYRVYRGGGLIATLGANATQYTTGDLGTGGVQNFYVQAFNNAGSANSNTAQEDGCIY